MQNSVYLQVSALNWMCSGSHSTLSYPDVLKQKVIRANARNRDNELQHNLNFYATVWFITPLNKQAIWYRVLREADSSLNGKETRCSYETGNFTVIVIRSRHFKISRESSVQSPLHTTSLRSITPSSLKQSLSLRIFDKHFSFPHVC